MPCCVNGLQQNTPMTRASASFGNRGWEAMMSSAPTQVTDAVGCRHKLGICLGRGGQGSVYSVKGTPFVVKLVDESRSSRQDQLRNQLTFVKRLDLKDLPIAKPLEMLREPHVGYVME